MPNWCEVDIKITGSKTQIRELRQTFTRQTNDYGDVVVPGFISWLSPEPPEVSQSINQEKSAELVPNSLPLWYTWRCANWGTKWDSDLVISKETDKQLAGTVQTAWSPPCEALKTFGKKYPDLKIQAKFFEAGMGFQGILRIEGGEVREYYETTYQGGRGG